MLTARTVLPVMLSGHIKLFVEAGVLKYIDDTNTVRTVQVLP